MPKASAGSVSRWIAGVKGGNSVASRQLWERYFSQLVHLAVERLPTRLRGESEEYVALSAIKSVMIGMRNNRFPDLSDRDSLWALMVTITTRKAITALRSQRARKRAVAREISFSDVEEFVGQRPTAEAAVDFADTLAQLMNKLNDPRLRRVAERKLSGRSNKEIAEELGCSTRTIVRKLNLIRQEWETDGADASQAISW